MIRIRRLAIFYLIKKRLIFHREIVGRADYGYSILLAWISLFRQTGTEIQGSFWLPSAARDSLGLTSHIGGCGVLRHPSGLVN